MRQVIVHERIGQIPSQKHGATIRTVDEYPLKKMGQVIVLWTNTLPVRNVGQVFVCGQI